MSNIGFSNNENVTKSMLSSVQDNPHNTNNLFTKQTKPLIPKKPGCSGGSGIVASQVNKFQSLNNNDHIELNSDQNDNSTNKSTNEITSL
jgi:hypothetical protein